MRRLKILFAGFSLFLLPLSAQAAESAACQLKNVKIENSQPKRYEFYSWKGKDIELLFKNWDPSKPTTFFNDYPLEVKMPKAKTSCKIEGGIWSVDKVYVSQDEKVIALMAGSGSSGELDFYDATNCKKLASVPADGPKNTVTGDRIVSEGVCEDFEKDGKKMGTCSAAGIYKLDAHCLPQLQEKDSKALSKKLYGVEFLNFATLQDPGTPKAKIVETKP